MLPHCEVLRSLGAPVLQDGAFPLKYNVHVVFIENGTRGQRFFGRDAPLNVLLESDLVELFACEVVGFGDGEGGGAEEVQLVLDYTVVEG